MAVRFDAGSLLAVDVGLKTGFALFGGDGRLRWYRSKHFPQASALRRAARQMLFSLEKPAVVCLEGGGALADVWDRSCQQLGIGVIRVSAERWRSVLLKESQQRSGKQAKREADELARRIIEDAGARRPTSLRHDTSEAILIGYWAVRSLGWLPSR